MLKSKDLISIQSLSVEEINLILDTAKSFKEISDRAIKKVPVLRGKTVVNLFYEPSTRTRISFELAAKRLSADLINVSVNTSSVVKGESLKDTIKTLESMQVSMVIIRHSEAGVPTLISRWVDFPIINAGDGSHAHPTQALIDMFTVREKRPNFKDLKVVIVGDILHSRVARSNIWGFTKLGAKVVLCGPPTLIPKEVEQLGVSVTYHLEEAILEADIVMLLRVQSERQKANYFPSIREYSRLYGLNVDKLKHNREILIMHPGPMNRDVEVIPEVAESPSSLINEQVTNGIAVRMAVLYLLAQKSKK
ncbi:aspartate carbamoyltransferase catalytic subunit [bacterium]|nr:aspartate carbamoyltransferase catalytic subunit [bacterium]MBU1153665.1 aspartate carbamoyltransferase catalytic subunit [bacterium]MBU1782240.1 aspartate carbamoyltransferase catalytic subunit [bacterium]MBU2599064.1 aspartate carbamoyltransferase catalytic subunit [bacterium]